MNATTAGLLKNSVGMTGFFRVFNASYIGANSSSVPSTARDVTKPSRGYLNFLKWIQGELIELQKVAL